MQMKTGLRRLRYFHKVAETLNFRRAAAELNITQPALSRAIALLEQDIGVTLFDRSTAKVALTRAGRTFVVECDRVLNTLAHAVEETQRVARGDIGSLAIGYTDTAIAGVIPDIIETFRQVVPGVTILLRQMPTCAQINMLRGGQLDVGLMTGPSDDAAFSTVPVQRDRLVALVPKVHKLANQASLRLRDLAPESFVLGDPNDWVVYNRNLMQICEDAGFAPRIVQTAPEVQAIIGLVSCGLGVTVMPQSHAVFLNTRTVALEIEDDIAPMLTEAVWIEGRDHPALDRFASHLRSYDLNSAMG